MISAVVRPRPLFSARRPWIYASTLGTLGTFLLVNFAVMPLVVRGNVVSIDPVVPTATPGHATANLLNDFNAQGFGVERLGRVTHPYLTGRGAILALANDNIQIFEYETDKIARAEALAIFKRAPRLTAKSTFHLYVQGNLIGLYFGYNAEVLRIAQGKLGPPMPKP